MFFQDSIVAVVVFVLLVIFYVRQCVYTETVIYIYKIVCFDIVYSLKGNDSVGENVLEVLERQLNDSSKEKTAIYRLRLNKYLTLPPLPTQHCL